MSIDDIRLLVAFLISVVTLVVLISRYSMSPFVALMIASMALAMIAGLDLVIAWEQFAAGVGGVLSSTAMVIGLGAMTGALLQRSGGAALIAKRLIDSLGPERMGWAMLIVGLLVGVGVWFTVGLVLLAPIAVSVARAARVSLLIPAMSMLAGLSAMHGLAPPHPGPLVALNLLGADTGRTIVWSLVVGSISAAVAGPLFFRLVDRRITLPIEMFNDSATDESTMPACRHLAAPLVVIVGPIVLMLVGSFLANSTAPIDGSIPWITWTVPALIAIGTPVMALLIGFLLAYVLLGTACGFTRPEIAKITEQSLYPVASILLVVAAGAGFSKILIASGVGDSLAQWAKQLPVPTLVLGWIVAATFRVTTGSATTAITAAGGIMSVMIAGDETIDREFLVLALGAGSLTLSHVNDGGFWFVKEIFSLSVEQTLKTWTVLETVLSIVALGVLLVLDFMM